jgi:membrane protein implicated in regulation of membrane protease activity
MAMQPHFFWLIVGIVLIVAELMTGTFYLLFLGIAALVAAAVAFLGGTLVVQAIVAAACSVAGVVWVHRHRRSIETKPMPSLDVGQHVTFESWVSQADKVARVQYRDAHWDAQIDGDCRGEPGEVFHIVAVEGSLLRVAKHRPA